MNTQRVEGHTPKVCPFCGTVPILYQGTWNDHGPMPWILECTPCMFQLQYGTKAKVIEAWNRRASIERLEKVNEALVRALEEAHAHLEYCNYGDSWERECAAEEKLSEKIEAALLLAKEPA